MLCFTDDIIKLHNLIILLHIIIDDKYSNGWFKIFVIAE